MSEAHETSVAVVDDTARTAGRGGLAIAVAKVWFLVVGFIQQLLLPRLVGVDGYGEISRVLAVVGVLNNVVVAMSIQGVSRAISSEPADRVNATFRRVLRLHALVAVVLAALFAVSAAPLASAIGAAHVARPLQIVSLVVMLYGLYAPLVGALNGRRRFADQAGLDIGYGALRTVGLLGGAVVGAQVGGNAVVGAVVGFAGAAALIVPVAAWRSGLGSASPAPAAARSPMSDYVVYLAWLFVGQVFLNLLLQTDFAILSRFIGDAAPSTAASDELVGVYRGVQLFSFLPYQLLMSVTFILFPLLARAHAEGDSDAVKRYTEQGVRLALLLTGLLCGRVGLAPHVLRFVFPEAIWTQGGGALRILAIGMGSLSILGIVSAALTSLGRAVVAMLLTMAAVALVAGGCFALVPGTPFGPEMLVRSAFATSVALTVAAVAGAIVLRRVAGRFAPVASLVRVGLAIGVTAFAGAHMPWLGKLLVVPQAVALGALYVVVLTVTRELGGADLARIRAVVARRATAGRVAG